MPFKDDVPMRYSDGCGKNVIFAGEEESRKSKVVHPSMLRGTVAGWLSARDRNRTGYVL